MIICITSTQMSLTNTTDTQTYASYFDLHLKSTMVEDYKQNNTTNVLTSLFQKSTSLSSVALFQHHQRMELTFHN